MPLELDHLLEASAEGDVEKVKLLLDQGIDVNSANAQGWTALTNAAYNQHSELVKFLVKHGADVNHANVNGTTVLMYAKSKIIGTQNYQTLNYLLDNGADPTRKDLKRNWTILDYIQELGDQDLINHIKNYRKK